MKITVATLTVDDGNEIITSVHPTLASAQQCLFDNYDSENEFGGDIQELLDGTGIVAYLDEHTVEVLILTRDITAADLAMDSADDDGYSAHDLIGPAGSVVKATGETDGDLIEVTGFVNDPCAVGFISTSDCRS